MKVKIKKLAMVAAVLVIAVLMVGCQSQANRVSHNLSKEADLFNIQRRVTVVNTRTDKILLEVIGRISIQYSSGDVDIIMEVAPGQYKKHFVKLNGWTAYVVEDVSGAFVDPYHYEINFLPEMLVPITFTAND